MGVRKKYSSEIIRESFSLEIIPFKQQEPNLANSQRAEWRTTCA